MCLQPTYLVFVARQVHGEVAVARVPHLERAVLAACDEQPAVGGPGALVDLWLYVRELLLVVRRRRRPRLNRGLPVRRGPVGS